MDSLVDLICFHFKTQLKKDCASTLLILKKLPDELLNRIGAMPENRPRLTIHNHHYTFYVSIDTNNTLDREVVDVMLPLILYQPITFYAYVGEGRDEWHCLRPYAHVSLNPFSGSKAYTFTKRDLEDNNCYVSISIY